MIEQAELYREPTPIVTLDADQRPPARIVVIGIGGAGGNSINQMVENNIRGVELVAVNTDIQALHTSRAPTKFDLGMKLTTGLGCGGSPHVGRKAALEDTERILALLRGSDMVFITGGEGGGTFTGAAPIFAGLASETGALTIAVVTMPFSFEGIKRGKNAETGLQELQQAAHAVIVIENENLLNVLDENVLLEDSFRFADDILCQAVQGISEVVTDPGIINTDLADVRTVMQHKGMIRMGRAEAEGPNRALEAAQRAISSPLMDGTPIIGAKAVLVNIAGSRRSLKLHEARAAAALIKEKCNAEDLIFGVTYNDSIGERIRVTAITTGLSQPDLQNNIDTGIDPVSVKLIPNPEEPRTSHDEFPWEELDRPSYLRRRAG